MATMMVSTPPRRSSRARTPPAPRHGPKDDDYEPYSPRRSTRSTLARNPYSSFNSDRSGDRRNDSSCERTPVRQRGGYTTPPPTTARKRARFASSVPQLFSPPSSPVEQSLGVKTPGRRRRSVRLSTSPADKEGSNTCEPPTSPGLGPTSHRIDRAFLLLTPSKTPTRRTTPKLSQKRDFSTFVQPASPSYVMPPSRKIKRFRAPAGLDVETSPSAGCSGRHIDIYTDPQSRVAELDKSESNPFITDRHFSSEVEMSNTRNGMGRADHFNEGVVYMKRGKKIFRPFAGSDTTYIHSHDAETGAPLRYSSRIKPIDLSKTQYQARSYGDELGESSNLPIDGRNEQDADSSLHAMSGDTSDSEASTISGGEASPTVAFASSRRNVRKANLRLTRNSQPSPDTTLVRSRPLEDPFTKQ